MFVYTNLLRRLPVALFNMKHFQTKTKIVVTPENYREVLGSVLLPQDRLLRQSSVGGGSTRVLVLDKMQGVKGVYHPLLCLPHPTAVDGGDKSLGVPIANYLESLQSSAGLPEVLTVVSHPEGTAFGTFTADGHEGLPLINLSAPSALDGAESEELVDDLMEAMRSPEIAKHLRRCRTYYFVRRDEKASLQLATLRKREMSLPDGARRTLPLSFMHPNWVSLPDVSLQTGRGEIVSIYARDPITKDSIVSAEGLLKSVRTGKLELDTSVKKMDTCRLANASASEG